MDNNVQIILSAKDVTGKAFESLNARVKSLTKSVFSFNGAIAGLAGGYTVQKITSDFLNAGIAAERLGKSMSAATGSLLAGAKAQQFVREQSERLGQVYMQQAELYKSIAAAAKGTNLEGEKTRQIYLGIVEAGTALQMTTEQMSGALRAVEQMMSKGKVQAEELRGQLGERLPGAFRIAADAMGVTTAELDKMLEQGKLMADDFLPRFAAALRERFGKDVPNAANSAQASLNRLQNSWVEFQQSVMGSGVLDELQNVVKNVNVEFSTWMETNKGLIQQKIPEYIQDIKNGLASIWDIISYDPAIIEYGIVGLAIGGRKGAVVAGGLAHVYKMVENQARAMGLVAAGYLDISEVAKANFEELDAILKNFDTNPALKNLKKQADELLEKIEWNESWGLNKEAEKLQKKLDQVYARIDAISGKKVGDAEIKKAATATLTWLDYVRDLNLAEKQLLSNAKEMQKVNDAIYAGNTTGLDFWRIQDADKKAVAERARLYEQAADGDRRRLEEFNDDYRRAVMDRYDYERYLLNKQAREWEADGRDRLMISKIYASRMAEINRRQAEEIQQQNEQITRSYQRMLDNIQDNFADTFYQMFDDGLDSWSDFLGRMGDMFKRLLAEMAAQAIMTPVVVPIVQSVYGSVGSLLGWGLSGLSAYGGGTSVAGGLTAGGGSGWAGNLLSVTNTSFGTASNSTSYINYGAGKLGLTGNGYTLNPSTGEYTASGEYISPEWSQGLNTAANIASMAYGAYQMGQALKMKTNVSKYGGWQPGQKFTTYGMGSAYFMGGLGGMMGGSSTLLLGLIDLLGGDEWLAKELDEWFGAVSMVPAMAKLSDSMFNRNQGKPAISFDDIKATYGTPYRPELQRYRGGRPFEIRGFSDEGVSEFAIPMQQKISDFYADYTNRLFIQTNEFVRQNFDDAATSSILDALAGTEIKWEKSRVNFYDPETSQLLDAEGIRANIEANAQELMKDMYMKVLPVLAQELAADDMYAKIRGDSIYQLPLERFLEGGVSGLAATVGTPEEMQERVSEFETYVNALNEIKSIWGDVNANFDSILEPAAQFTEALTAMDDGLTAAIDSLQTMGFAEEALTDLESKRAQVLQKMKDEYWGDVQSSVSELLYPSSYVSSLRQVVDAFDEWKQALEETGAPLGQVTALEQQRTMALENLFSSLQDNFLGSGMGQIESSLKSINTEFHGIVTYLLSIQSSAAEIARYQDLWTNALTAAIRSPLQGLQASVSGWRQSLIRTGWGQREWIDEYNAIGEQLAGLDPTTASYYDQSLALLQQQFAALQAIAGLGEQSLSVAQQELSTTQQQLATLDGSIASIDQTIFDLTSGSLAAVQSIEGYQTQYDRLLEAAKSNTSDQALVEFTQFATGDFMEAMGAFGYGQQEINDLLVTDFRALRQAYVTERDLLETIAANTQATVDELSYTADIVSTEGTLADLLAALEASIQTRIDNIDYSFQAQADTQAQVNLSTAPAYTTESAGVSGFLGSQVAQHAAVVGGYDSVQALWDQMTASDAGLGARSIQIGSGTLYAQMNPWDAAEVYGQYVDPGESFSDQSGRFVAPGLQTGWTGDIVTSAAVLADTVVGGHLGALGLMTGQDQTALLDDLKSALTAQGGGARYDTVSGEHGYTVQLVDWVARRYPAGYRGPQVMDPQFRVSLFERGGLTDRPAVFGEAGPEWAVPVAASPHNRSFLRDVGVERLIEKLDPEAIGRAIARELVPYLARLGDQGSDRPIEIRLDSRVLATALDRFAGQHPRETKNISNRWRAS